MSAMLQNLHRTCFGRSLQRNQTIVNRPNRRPRLEQLEDRVTPAVTVDLFNAGSFGVINGARFEEVVSTSSTGTGVFNTFAELQAGSNDFDHNGATEQGVNYDRSGALGGGAQNPQYDESNSGPHNRFLLLSDVAIRNIGGTAYREFFLDN